MAEVKVVRQGLDTQKLQLVDAAIRKGLTLGGLLLVQRASRILVMNKPRGVATGQMVRSLTVSKVVFDGGWYKIRVGPTVDYSWWVHQGRPPGKFPPWDPQTGGVIYQWVKQKNIGIAFVPSGKGRKKAVIVGGRTSIRKSDIEKAQRSLAFLIARKIAREGIEPYPFLLGACLASKNDIREVVIGEVYRALGGR